MWSPGRRSCSPPRIPIALDTGPLPCVRSPCVRTAVARNESQPPSEWRFHDAHVRRWRGGISGDRPRVIIDPEFTDLRAEAGSAQSIELGARLARTQVVTGLIGRSSDGPRTREGSCPSSLAPIRHRHHQQPLAGPGSRTELPESERLGRRMNPVKSGGSGRCEDPNR
jgi:hypothetical protein